MSDVVDAFERLDAMMSAYVGKPSEEAFDDWYQEYRASVVQVRLVESPRVAEERRNYERVIRQLGEKATRERRAGKSYVDVLGRAYSELRETWIERRRALSDAMHADLGFHR